MWKVNCDFVAGEFLRRVGASKELSRNKTYLGDRRNVDKFSFIIIAKWKEFIKH